MTPWRIMRIKCEGTQATALTETARPLLLVFPADAVGETLAGAFAAKTGAAVVGRIITARQEGADLIVTRSTHGGRLILALRVLPGLAVATANDLECEAALSLGQPDGLCVEREPLPSEGTSLDGADIVIGGGRGLDVEGFAQLERIASALNGAVSASLPAVDLGLAPVSRQVGQSGKFVNPKIYFAAGMSGTPQHFAGIGARARIVAVNTDRDAPIFSLAEAGAIADARILLPLIADALENMQAT
ncbi:MAG: FAD-binding protein [Sphingobium sp.]|jgi:electron transfer flavoprotein alpha subunit|nr:FAD-binding protein [Sphingobium sp.]MCI1270217.1 FAD-binding protein [Sphingobium sp.]MCI2053329.1 FAD-binding protein [Sphingobium sp.]